MASTLNALTTGGGGIVATGDSSGVMQLQTNNGTTAVTIDTSQNVGIGTASPSYNLDVQTASGQATINVVGGTGRGNVQLSTGAADGSGVSVGFLGFFGGESTSGSAEARVAGIATTTEGATANHRGGRITFNTKADNVASLSERMRITSGGEVYIAGTTDQGAYNLQCNGTGVWGAGAYVNGSDERIKQDITPIDTGLDVVIKLNPVTYKYKEDWSKDQSTQTGFIAQELLLALEGKNYVDGIVQQGGEYMSVAYQNIIPILTKAIQEQQTIINDLKARIETLEAK